MTVAAHEPTQFRASLNSCSCCVSLHWSLSTDAASACTGAWALLLLHTGTVSQSLSRKTQTLVLQPVDTQRADTVQEGGIFLLQLPCLSGTRKIEQHWLFLSHELQCSVGSLQTGKSPRKEER